jgi:hypothetical protein
VGGPEVSGFNRTYLYGQFPSHERKTLAKSYPGNPEGLDRHMEEISERQKSVDKEKEYLLLWKSKGVTVIEPDVEAFREATKDVWKDFLTEPGEREIYERIKTTR